MDQIDQKILRSLQEDASLTNAELSDAIGLSPAACHRRVKALESNGVIESYRALLNANTLGFRTSVFISVELDSQHADQLRAFESEVIMIPEVMDCTLVAGTSDYLIRVVVKDVEDYERLHRTKLTALPHVARLQSQFSLKKVVRKTALPL